MKKVFAISFVVLGIFGSDSKPQEAKQKFSENQFSESRTLYEEAKDEYQDQKSALELGKFFNTLG